MEATEQEAYAKGILEGIQGELGIISSKCEGDATMNPLLVGVSPRSETGLSHDKAARQTIVSG